MRSYLPSLSCRAFSVCADLRSQHPMELLLGSDQSRNLFNCGNNRCRCRCWCWCRLPSRFHIAYVWNFPLGALFMSFLTSPSTDWLTKWLTDWHRVYFLYVYLIQLSRSKDVITYAITMWRMFPLPFLVVYGGSQEQHKLLGSVSSGGLSDIILCTRLLLVFPKWDLTHEMQEFRRKTSIEH